jgi:hypothetical protein
VATRRLRPAERHRSGGAVAMGMFDDLIEQHAPKAKADGFSFEEAHGGAAPAAKGAFSFEEAHGLDQKPEGGMFDDLIAEHAPKDEAPEGVPGMMGGVNAGALMAPQEPAPAAIVPANAFAPPESVMPPSTSPIADRFKANVREGFDNTSTGEVINRVQSGQVAQTAADDMFRAITEARQANSPVGLDVYQPTEADKASKFPGLHQPQPNPYAGVPLSKLEADFNKASQEAAAKAETFGAAREEQQAKDAAIPSFADAPTFKDKAIQGAVALAGQLVGGAAGPENLIGGPGKGLVREAGEGVIKRAARDMLPGAIAGAAGGGVAAPAVMSSKAERGEGEGLTGENLGEQVALGAAVGAAFHIPGMLARPVLERIAAKRGVPIDKLDPDHVSQTEVQETFKDPEIAALAKANGIESPTDARVPVLEQKLAARKDAEALRTPDQPADTLRGQDAEVGRRQAEVQGVTDETINPAATNIIKRTPDETPIRVDREGNAFRADAGALEGREKAGALQRADTKLLPAPGRAVPTEEEIAQQRAAKEGGRQSTVETPPKLYGQEGRAPQDSAGLETQRQAGEAFDLAQRQRDRARADVRDTQTAGRPEGANPQTIHLDEGHPVQIVNRRMVPDAKGNMVDVATVRRYDPRTGKPADDHVEYDVPARQLKTGQYAAEPRMAQDFEARAGTPEGEQMGLPRQTYRTTPPDDNAAGTARASRPEQPSGDHPGPRFSKAEEAMRDFAERQARGEESPKGDQYEGQKTSTKAAKPDRDGRFTVDENGYVKSDKEGPVRFADQKQAAKWIINEGHKKSPDQVFEIANHPGGKGFTVRERGRTEPPHEAQAHADSAISEHGLSEEGLHELAQLYHRDEGETVQQAWDRATERWAEKTEADANQRINTGEEVDHDQIPFEHDREGEPNGGDGHAPADERAERPGSDEAGGQAGRGREDAARDTNAVAQHGSEVEGAERSTDRNVTERQSDQVGKSDGFSPGNTFHANPLFDPSVWSWFGKGLGFNDRWRRDVSGLADDIKRLREKDDGRKTKTWADVGRLAVYSDDAVLRAVGDKYESPTIKAIADKLFAPADMGRGGAVGRTYTEAVRAQSGRNINELARIMEPFIDKKGVTDQIVRLVQSPNSIRAGTAIGDAAKAIRKLLDDEHAYLKQAGVDAGYVKGYYPREVDSMTVLGKPDAFRADAERAYRASGLDSAAAKDAAEGWMQRVVLGGMNVRADGTDFVRFGATPSRDFAKGRVLSKAADEIMARWYHRDPLEALTVHFQRTARRAEWARRFGDDLAEWKKLKEAMIKEGNAGAISDVVDAVASATGARPPALPRAVQSAIGWARFYGVTGLLTHASITSLSEVLMPSIRSGSPGRVLGDLARTTRAIWERSGKLGEQREFAEDLGLIMRGSDAGLLASRFNATNPASRVQERWMNRFFRATGLEQWTSATRVTAVNAAETFIRRLALDVNGNRSRQASSRSLLKEMGVEDTDGFAKWVAAADKSDKLGRDFAEGGHAETYRTAVTRFADQSILSPSASTRPRWANHPLGSLIFMLQSYNYAFQKNVLNRAFGGVKESVARGKDYTLGDRATMLAPIAMLPAMMAMQLAIAPVRQAVMGGSSKKQTDDQQTNQYIMQAFQRSLSGAWDPIVNVIAAAKYHRGVASSLLGPVAAQPAQALDTLIGLSPQEAGGPNSPKTNSAERNATRAIYQMLIAPAVAAAGAWLPGPLGVAATQAPGLTDVRDAFIDSVAGPQRTADGHGRPQRPQRPQRPTRD